MIWFSFAFVLNKQMEQTPYMYVYMLLTKRFGVKLADIQIDTNWQYTSVCGARIFSNWAYMWNNLAEFLKSKNKLNQIRWIQDFLLRDEIFGIQESARMQ